MPSELLLVLVPEPALLELEAGAPAVGLPAGPMTAPEPASTVPLSGGWRSCAGGVELGICAGGAGARGALLPRLPSLRALGFDFDLGFGGAFGFAAGLTAGDEERGAVAPGIVRPLPELLGLEAPDVGEVACEGVWTLPAELVAGLVRTIGPLCGDETAVAGGAAGAL